MSQYNSDLAFPPCDAIQDVLDEKKMTLDDLAKETGCSIDVIELLVSGKISIDHKIAGCLEKAFGVSSSFWLNCEKHYQESFNRKNSENMVDKLRNIKKNQ